MAGILWVYNQLYIVLYTFFDIDVGRKVFGRLIGIIHQSLGPFGVVCRVISIRKTD